MSSKEKYFWKILNLNEDISYELKNSKISSILEQVDDKVHYYKEENFDLFNNDEELYIKYLLKKNFDEIIVSESWEITNPNLTRLPDNIYVDGDLTLTLPMLETLPNGMQIEGNLRVHAPLLTTLPDDLYVEKALDIIKTQITEPPNNIKADKVLTKNNLKFTIKIDLSDSGSYLDVGRDYRKDIFSEIFSGDYHEWFSNYENDWKSSLDYYVNSENQKKIEALVKEYMTKNGVDPEEIEDDSLEGLIEYLDLDEIQHALSNAETSATNDAYQDHLAKSVISCFEDYGDVEKIDWETIKLTVDLSPIILGLSDEEFGDYYQRCDLDLECWFIEMRGNEIDIPKFNPDDRYTPDLDKENYNSILSDNLDQIEI